MVRPVTSSAIVGVPAHHTLKRVVVWFRLVAFAWLVGLCIATLLTDPDAERAWVIATLTISSGSVVATVALAHRGGLASTAWVLTDGAFALFIVIAPSLAGSADLFYGGYPLSWLMLLVWARPALGWGIAGVTALVMAQLAGSAIGVRVLTATDFVGDISVWIVSGLVYGWGLYAIRLSDYQRLEAQEALARARVATEIADDLHDSVLQSLAAIRMRPEGVDPRAVAIRLDREIRQEINRIRADHRDGFRVSVYDTTCDVSTQMGVDLDRPMVTGDAPPSTGLQVLIGATREALVNAVKHSGTTEIHVSGEVGPTTLTTVVHDAGTGFDPARGAGAGLHSIRSRITAVGGTATLETTPGRGTTWVLSVPR